MLLPFSNYIVFSAKYLVKWATDILVWYSRYLQRISGKHKFLRHVPIVEAYGINNKKVDVKLEKSCAIYLYQGCHVHASILLSGFVALLTGSVVFT